MIRNPEIDGSIRQPRTWCEARLRLPAPVELRQRRLSPLRCDPRPLEELKALRPDLIRGHGSPLGAFFRWVALEGRRHLDFDPQGTLRASNLPRLAAELARRLG